MCSSFVRVVDVIYKNSKIAVFISPSGSKLHATGLLDSSLASQADYLRGTTIVAIYNEVLYSKSAAIVCILRHSNVQLAVITGKIINFIPAAIADFIYGLIARSRYFISRLFPSACMLALDNVTLVRDE